MNLPVINPIVKNVSLDKIEVNRLFLDLFEKKFEGYCYLCVLEKFGFEESILLLSNGQIIGSIFLVPGYDVELFGKEAVQGTVNGYGSKNGILNIFGLTQDQTKLVLLFNEKIKLLKNIAPDKKKDFIFKNVIYNEEVVKEILKDKFSEEKTNKEILNKFNLNDLLRV